MKEIEVKARIKDPDVVMKRLKSLGCILSKPLIQHDRIFIRKVQSFPETSKGDAFLRIRNENGIHTFNMKVQQENVLDNIESETEIKDPIQLENILKHLGFVNIVEVKKERIKTKYNGLEICVDKVEKLGNFIEVEKLSEEGDSLRIQEELFRLLESLGVKRENRVTEGYDQMAYKMKSH